MLFVIIISFALASGVRGEVAINRAPPMTSLAQCEAVREAEVAGWRHRLEQIHGAMASFGSRCEAPGMPV